MTVYPVEADRVQLASFLQNKVPRLVSDGLKPNVIKIWDGGLEKIQDGLQYMMDGKISAEKLVYRV